MGPLSTLLIALATCGAWSATEGRRVVVIPMPHTSHTKYHINIAHELVKLGHEVWLTMPDFLLAKGVLDVSPAGVIEYSPPINVEEHSLIFLRDKSLKGEREDFPGFVQVVDEFCDSFLKNETMLDKIRSLRPDFILIDNVLLKPFTIIPYRLGVPFGFAGTAYDPIAQRIPFMPAVTPVCLFPYSDHMKFTERLINTVFYIVTTLINYYNDCGIVSKYAPEMPDLPLDRLVARAEIWLVEIDHILDYPRPSIPNVKLIGGTATSPAKPLPAKFQSFMDSATQGVVIVSFGSYVLNLPKELSDKVLQVLLQLPMKSVFRSNLPSPDPDKILMATWIPQNDLLAHPNTKVFFSHCGKNGQYEALYHAVPIVAAPLFGDQAYNAERARIKGFSETVDLITTTADEMGKVVMKVVTEKRYKQAISKASELFRIEFGVPVERAAFWLDHVMKYGGAHMRSAGHNMPYYQFLGLDILTFLTVLILVFDFLLILCCYKSLRWMFCLDKSRKPKKD